MILTWIQNVLSLKWSTYDVKLYLYRLKVIEETVQGEKWPLSTLRSETPQKQWVEFIARFETPYNALHPLRCYVTI